MSDRILMAPSILSADFTALGEAVSLVERAGADFIHVDVMDGHFVPNLTLGPPVIKALKAACDTPLDVHLMIDDADGTIDWYLDTGADLVSVHVEACTHLHRVLGRIRERGARAGVALNPATPVESIRDVIGMVDLVLIMSVNPGFGGQKFIENSVRRIEQLARMCDKEGVRPIIQVDGGMTVETAPLVSSVGATCLVAGNAVFAQPDPASAMNAIREAAAAAAC